MDRFWSKVDMNPHHCWEWQASLLKTGYGQFNFRGTMWRAHRVAWTLTHGEIPEGLTIDHLCRNIVCMNPEHMELVTRAENTRRGNRDQVRKAECRKGHSRWGTQSSGARRCLDCTAANSRKYREAARV